MYERTFSPVITLRCSTVLSNTVILFRSESHSSFKLSLSLSKSPLFFVNSILTFVISTLCL